MTRRLIILTVAALAGLITLYQAASIPSARADEIDEELQSTISSDPEYRGRKAPARAPADEPPPPATDSGGSGEEWQTMHSETHRPRASRGSSGGGVSSIKVDQDKNRIYTPKISFSSNSDMPTPASMSVLKSLANTLVKRQELVVRIEGHTDSIGYDQPNLELSQRRADRVKDILTRNGVDASRLQAVGMGDKYPVASSTTPAGQEKNRRVDFHLIAGTAPSSPARPASPVAPPPPPPPAPAPVAPPPPPPPPAR